MIHCQKSEACEFQISHGRQTKKLLAFNRIKWGIHGGNNGRIECSLYI